MDVIQPHLEFLLRHVLVVVFVAFLVEAAGVPALVVVGTVGSMIGDHVPYVAGALMGPRILALQFLTFDLLGTLAYIAVWTTVGYLIGQRAMQ